MKIKIVTGYTPIINHPRTAEEYGRLGEQLFRNLNAPVKAFYTSLSDCWLHRFIEAQPFLVKPAAGDNPEKNSVAYHVVQHQKSEWLLAHAMTDQDQADTYVWMDYGIVHQPGVTPEIVNAFLARVAKDDFAIPGCWDDTSGPVEMTYPNWRFCGSLLVVPRQHIKAFDAEMKAIAKRKVKQLRMIDWEVNTLARLERLKRVPIRWYRGNHDSTQFSNYTPPGGEC